MGWNGRTSSKGKGGRLEDSRGRLRKLVPSVRINIMASFWFDKALPYIVIPSKNIHSDLSPFWENN